MILSKITELEAERKATFMNEHAETYMEHIRLILQLDTTPMQVKLEQIKSYLEVSYMRGTTDGYSVFNEINRLTMEGAS